MSEAQELAEVYNQPPLHEGIDDATLNHFLDWVGNNEAKMLTAAVVLTEPEEAFSSTRLYHELMSRQGTNPEWDNLSRGVASSYCQRSLSKGYVAITSVQGARRHDVEAYQAEEQGRETTLAMLGGLLDWSLDDSNISVQILLGTTSGLRDDRSPETRYQIYQDLLTRSDNARILDIASSLGASDENAYRRILAQLYYMKDRGLVTIDEKRRDYNPSFRVNIRDPQAERVTPMTGAVYTALDSLAGSIVELDSLVARVIEINPTLNPATVRQRIVQAAYNKRSRGFTALEPLEDQAMLNRTLTSVAISPNALPSIEGFCERVERIQSDKDRGEYIERAREIVDDPSSFAKLMGKAKEVSAFHDSQHSGNEVQQARIMSLLRNTGALSTKNIVERLNQGGEGVPLTTSRVQAAIGDLVSVGLLEGTVIQPHPQKTTKVTYYGPRTYS